MFCEVSAVDRNINKWQKLNELRRTDPHICGGYYTKKFLKTYRPDFYAEGYDFFPEFVRVAEKDGEIFCRLEEANVPDEDAPIDSDECMLETSLGTFVSSDYGEFGGVLETPGGEINGNFCDVFEAGGKIYAVDSLSHLGLASTTVYSFDCGCKYHKIFSDENLDFKARYATGERAYILVSGSVSTRSGGEKLKSILLEISENGIDAKTEFDCGFYLVFNMIVKNGKMILGVDKAVVVFDLQTKEINAYTPLSVEAEKHIIGMSR